MSLLGPDGQPVPRNTEPVSPGPDAENTPAPVQVTTAFLVTIAGNGRVSVTEDLAFPAVPMRKPTFDDIIGAAANLQAEISARKTADMAAAATVQTQMAVARQMQEATANAQVQAMLAKGHAT